ncbi:hypothetical protein VSR01_25235 [Actinacidiphila sp. DG2A-62]|uniref:hypothetical protein n=1 Tax=Actinacidiphila sp. DG2A-62 TaxID=3108821 RepID=UPI002DB9E340|nr:hypothetical protein [Actinacidiphila sp. DG2A-62]MEC3996631.1 hypothetical protein [Actinacidiphila sp. DG2A-62]
MAGETAGGAAGGTRCQVDMGEGGRFSWRLIASNGRVIALGANAYLDEATCREAFEELCARPGDLTGGVQHAAEANGWVWRLRDAAGAVRAVSARSYERHSTCQAAYERFRVLLPALGRAPMSP